MCNSKNISVSHTTDDLVFIWDPQMPLDVDKGIELPQLELISTKNDDCTTEYSTGKNLLYRDPKIESPFLKSNLINFKAMIWIKNNNFCNLGYKKLAKKSNFCVSKLAKIIFSTILKQMFQLGAFYIQCLHLLRHC